MGGILQIHHCIRRSDQGLFACYAAAAAGVAVSRARGGQPVLRLIAGGGSGAVSNDGDNPDQPVVEALGVNVYAKQLVDGRDRAQLERLARYVLRLPLSQERLEWSADGRLQLTLKNVWKDGTRALLLEPHDLLARLCAAIPPPGFHLTTYWGGPVESFITPPASGAGVRRPRPISSRACRGRSTRAELRRQRSRQRALEMGLAVATCVSPRRRNLRVLRGPMRWVEAATKASTIDRLLAKHGLALQPPPQRPFVPAGQLSLRLG